MFNYKYPDFLKIFPENLFYEIGDISDLKVFFPKNFYGIQGDILVKNDFTRFRGLTPFLTPDFVSVRGGIRGRGPPLFREGVVCQTDGPPYNVFNNECS